MAQGKRNHSRRKAVLTEQLQDKCICICAGAGGAGKTTVSAALALGLASQGKKVAVITIDPARRLAHAIGLEGLSGEPQLIDPERFEAHGVRMRGQLWAMMLDTKGTFDQLISHLAPDERTRREILANRIYQELSSAVAGSQEFTAVVKLFQLHHEHSFDVIVLDTPPSRNALDFLHAPTRLTQFLQGRALRLFLAPSGVAARVLGRGGGLLFSLFARLTGVDLLADLSSFFSSLADLIEGFSERAHAVSELLRDPATAFFLITSTEQSSAMEAVFLAQTLTQHDMHVGAVIVNRVHQDGFCGHSAEQLSALLQPQLGSRLTRKMASNLDDLEVLARRDQQTLRYLRSALPETPTVIVPHLDADVQDLSRLVQVERHLFG